MLGNKGFLAYKMLLLQEHSASLKMSHYLLTYDSYWVCVTNIGCKPNKVQVYNSMRTDNVSISTKECIAILALELSLLSTFCSLRFSSSLMLLVVVSLPWHMPTLFVRDSIHHSWCTNLLSSITLQLLHQEKRNDKI